ncbi:MAG: hypothetical protein PF637_08525 [Spirochaetes bacterium]|jgi:hypothetical protein|nr:hypothetical protein [Spirochaetota bacterium]
MESNTMQIFDAELKIMNNSKILWKNESLTRKYPFLKRIRKNFVRRMGDWVLLSCAAKQYSKGSDLQGEEWMCANIILRQFDMQLLSLKESIRYGAPKIPESKGNILTVLPRLKSDKTFYKEVSAEIYLSDDSCQESVYSANEAGNLTLILAAGNHSFLIIADILNYMFQQSQTIVVKVNPVNEYLSSILEEIFQPLIEMNYILFINGDTETSKYLTTHKYIDALHLTGSDKTYEQIVYGLNLKNTDNKSIKVINKRPFSAELGNITPIIIMPGKWSIDELYLQVLHVANMFVNNCSFNCITPRLLVMHDEWTQKNQFLKMLKDYLTSRPANYSYYPNAEMVYSQFMDAYTNAEKLGEEKSGHLPWTFIPGLDWQNKDEMIFNSEPYCPIMGEVSIPGDDISDYVRNTVSFLNETVWGNLAAMILVHPDSLKDDLYNKAFQQAIKNLRYGTIGINIWAAMAFFLGVTPWGAFPGNHSANIQSGKGVICNLFNLKGIQKSVIKGPFKAEGLDPWVLSGYAGFAKNLTYLNASFSLWRLFKFLKSMKFMTKNAEHKIIKNIIKLNATPKEI